MRNRKLNHNKGIMLGIMAMAVVVLAVVVVFWLWCFPDGSLQAETDENNTRIVLAEGFCGDSIQLTVNDTLLLDCRVGADSLEVPVDLPEENHLLMVAFPEHDVVTSFDLPAGVKQVVLRNRDGNVDMDAF